VVIFRHDARQLDWDFRVLRDVGEVGHHLRAVQLVVRRRIERIQRNGARVVFVENAHFGGRQNAVRVQGNM